MSTPGGGKTEKEARNFRDDLDYLAIWWRASVLCRLSAFREEINVLAKHFKKEQKRRGRNVSR